MKNIYKLSLIVIFGASLMSSAFAEKTYSLTNKSESQSKSGQSTLSEACQPATAATDLDINNVRFRVLTGGDMWWDLQHNAKYYIPKDTKKTSMYSGSLWMAGVDVNGQLKCCAQTYRARGNDFWPGPLTTDGAASIDAETCKKFDKHFKMTKAMVQQHIAWFKNPTAFPNYQIPEEITNWPAHGDVTKGQDKYLAPFFDYDGNGSYDPTAGDYPYYDVDGTTCGKYDPKTKQSIGDRVLFGDATLWWVFNDKGNIHSETNGSPIGFEIRAQAFGFTTNDEINNMTFYNFQIINRSTYTLTNTYFSLWTDTDLGYGGDDFVGCDVMRGLGYCYNGTAVDGSGKDDHYGANPPAVGVDFFQGPYMDANGIADRFYPDSISNYGDPRTSPNWCGINGVGFNDTVVDNERFGMRRFVYHNNGSSSLATTDPVKAMDYYNLLRGIWKDNQKMQYGKNGHPKSGAYGPDCDFMFPGVTDIYNWGTGGNLPNGGATAKNWTEEIAGNVAYDRRFMHSAGPFTLNPGAVNYITVGIPWARATSGGPMASVELLKIADDKCQRLFDHCFKMIDGPDAPDLSIQELDKQIILTLTNPVSSNNYGEGYPFVKDGKVDTIPTEYDFNIVTPVSATKRYDSLYRFEGYLIYQLKDNTVSLGELENSDKARLVAQTDVKNGIGRIINYEYDDGLNASVPVEKVSGVDAGIKHSFVVSQDMFATGDKNLINHKKYYYVAISYAYNNYKTYNQTDATAIDGQKLPFKSGRKAAGGNSITVKTAIPHITSPEAGGTSANTLYGFGPKVTRIEGFGNGGLTLDFTPEAEKVILDCTAVPYINLRPRYSNNAGPVDIRVIDPLNVPSDSFTLKFIPGALNSIDNSTWELRSVQTDKVYYSQKAISIYNEQLIPELGLAITIKQPSVLTTATGPGALITDSINSFNEVILEASQRYSDSSKVWCYWIKDQDVPSAFNWIRAGTQKADKTLGWNGQYVGDRVLDGNGTNTILKGGGIYTDPIQQFEKVLEGAFAPYKLVSFSKDNPGFPDATAWKRNPLSMLGSVDIVLTNDQSKWTRCPVIEMGEDASLNEGNVAKGFMRSGNSKNKDGSVDLTSTGMSWFPGYAISIETGERLNIFFSENSSDTINNGRDMLFNPTSRFTDQNDSTVFGGKHFIYVVGHYGAVTDFATTYAPAYDGGVWLDSTLHKNTAIETRKVFQNVSWVGMPVAMPGNERYWLSNDLRIRIRIATKYAQYLNAEGMSVSVPQNGNYPMYGFSTAGLQADKNNVQVAKDALDLINIVPNPYYAYSSYETNQLDNRVKIVNLPERCEISIYSVGGILIRKYSKDDVGTSLDWDLKNYAGIPIASGLYLIHVKADGVGERVVKWFGTMRPIDLDSF